MLTKIQSLTAEFLQALENTKNQKQLDDLRLVFLSRNGSIASLFEEMKKAPKEDKPVLGKELNCLRNLAEEKFNFKKTEFEELLTKKSQQIDLTLPCRKVEIGHKHLLTQTLDEIKSIFKGLGFSLFEGPELESDYYNFEALNFPADHPARDMQDTFFVNKNFLLRTHTSPVQVRLMEKLQPPLRAIMPGKVYRNEAISSRSHCMFHQVEGLCVDTDITFAELKGTLVAFTKQFYGKDLNYRFRPSFFPFTEPSAEMDITCFLCKGKGCRVCKHSGWLEILGCGMVDPNVFAYAKYDNEKYTGYAFGMGIERTAMLKYGITDIRTFFENDVRFLKQF
ncbi:MAG: phenylalanine--tRNA ligase subunit alpha [Ignavibacteria bacterium CG_4_8_14_3_um_filter_37_9]|nr:phenylalanine--tRNA ligase subunit alpha [Ignavibacteria bacterium]OIO17877.1 MAG: phenylalanine--tRNA ligase subunit alpha [Ignavibacteria bacterium CG1_02_37_35]PIS45065.1 MAG: phenylalanine--tRNA ligase subunit alpha [Ignavibacteria bacterium CG08_land_8_20_14_0_20_37_9]PIW99289.1 MAG: phenylalanine--tRNA ligase subunit alpha [Ignavibacteria bacterium CG_4_8_14_3_um_filter_37_9]PIX94322.1 MAG: phenylalanine--tRNA ligase subunit alpha [Ignavibacteria bacterium CG_4_10_14_3_um_filter_37_18]